PTRAASVAVTALSPASPSSAKGNRNRASLDAMATSLCSGVVAPNPIANPFTALISGFGNRISSSMHGLGPCRRPSSCAIFLPISARSQPAENARPVPVSTTHLTPWSTSESTRIAVRSSNITSVKQFSFSGRDSVMHRTPPSSSTTSSSLPSRLMPSSFPPLPARSGAPGADHHEGDRGRLVADHPPAVTGAVLDARVPGVQHHLGLVVELEAHPTAGHQGEVGRVGGVHTGIVGVHRGRQVPAEMVRPTVLDGRRLSRRENHGEEPHAAHRGEELRRLRVLSGPGEPGRLVRAPERVEVARPGHVHRLDLVVADEHRAALTVTGHDQTSGHGTASLQ